MHVQRVPSVTATCVRPNKWTDQRYHQRGKSDPTSLPEVIQLIFQPRVSPKLRNISFATKDGKAKLRLLKCGCQISSGLLTKGRFYCQATRPMSSKALGVLSSNLIFAIVPCADLHPSTPPTHWQLQVPRREASLFLFHFFDTLHSARRHAALVPHQGSQELRFRHPLGRDTHSSPQSCARCLPAPADPPGTRHLQPDPRQH